MLVELGLGIDRRLHAKRNEQRQRPLESEVSFWYLANQLGPRFLRDAQRRVPGLESCGEGVWRGQVLDYPCVLVSIVDLPVDEDSLPLHVLGLEPAEKQRQVGRFVVEQVGRVEAYGTVFAALHPSIWKELQVMARAARSKFTPDIRAAVEWVGLKEVIRQIGEKALIEEIGEKSVIEQIGKKSVIEQIGKKELLEQLDVDDILSHLSRAKRLQLEQRLRQMKGESID